MCDKFVRHVKVINHRSLGGVRLGMCSLLNTNIKLSSNHKVFMTVPFITLYTHIDIPKMNYVERKRGVRVCNTEVQF